MKRLFLVLTIAIMTVVLAVTASATVSMTFDLEETTTDDGQPVNVIVATMTDDEGDWRALKLDLTFDNTVIIPVDYMDGSVPDYSDAEGATYPFAFGSYKTGRSTTEISIIDGPNWVMNGANSTMGFESYWSQLEKYPIDCTEGFVVFELFFKYADGKSEADFTSDSFKIDYAHYANGTNHYVGNADDALNDIVLTNNVVPEPEAPVVITISVKAGDKVYLQDSTVVNIDADNDAYEVPSTVGYVAVNSGIVTNNGFTAQKTYYIDGKAATAVHDNALYGTADIDLRVKAEDADRNGLRFRTLHNLNTRSVENNEIAEIGFIMAAETERFITKFGADYDLTLDKTGKIDGVTYAKVGIAYGVENGENVNKAVDKIGKNTGSDKIWDIRAVMYNIPEDFYQTTIACRPYYKVGEAVVYGEVAKMTLYDAAKSIKDNAASWEACNEDQQAYINSIIEKVEGPGIIVEDEVIIDIGGLYE